MTAIRTVAMIVIIAMIVLGANILVNSNLDEGLGMDRFFAGLADPWQAFIGFDLMTGLLLAACWIIYREQGSRMLNTIAWVLCLTWWGNIVTAAYILVALGQSSGDAARFFTGARAGPLRRVWPGENMAVRIACLTAATALAAFAVSKMMALGLAGLPGLAYLPGFMPVVLALVLLGLPAPRRSAHRGS